MTTKRRVADQATEVALTPAHVSDEATYYSDDEEDRQREGQVGEEIESGSSSS